MLISLTAPFQEIAFDAERADKKAAAAETQQKQPKTFIPLSSVQIYTKCNEPTTFAPPHTDVPLDNNLYVINIAREDMRQMEWAVFEQYSEILKFNGFTEDEIHKILLAEFPKYLVEQAAAEGFSMAYIARFIAHLRPELVNPFMAIIRPLYLTGLKKEAGRLRALRREYKSKRRLKKLLRGLSGESKPEADE